MGRYIAIFFQTFVNIMSFLLLVYCVISWFVPPYNEFRMRLDNFMNMFLDPIRKVMPRFGMLDLSPMILLLLLQLVERLIMMIF